MIDLTAVHKLIWDKLSKLSCNIYDYVPYGLLDFPYAYVGGFYTKEDNTKNTEGISCELYINIISAYRGRKEILELMNQVNNIMSQDFSNDKYTIFIKQGRHAISQEKDEVGWGKNDNNVFYHAVLVFDIEIKKNNNNQ
jgi:hypothetical protein